MHRFIKPDEADRDPELVRVLSIAVRAADLGIWQWDLGTQEFVYSGRAKEIFGFPEDQPVTRDQIVAVLHPDDHQIVREQAALALDSDDPKREPYLYRIRRANDGAQRWVQAFGELVFETVAGERKPVRFIGTLQDVTEEIVAKQDLARQEARLRLAIEASGIAIWEINLADQSIAHSPELNRLCGFPPDARPTLDDFRSRYAPGERERIEREGAEARARGETKYRSEIRQIWPDGTEKWLSLRAQLAPGEKNYGGRVIGVLVDVTEQKKREERQALLVSEFQHRVKNSFALTQSIVNQTLRGEDVADHLRLKLSSRLQLMADAHEIIAHGSWERASLGALLKRIAGPFEGEDGDRVTVRGDEVDLSPAAALSFALVLHELFTNASKYGALSNDTGRVEITSRSDHVAEPPFLLFEWVERDGPAVIQPTETGFGTRLIQRAFAAEFDTTVKSEFAPEGFRLTMRVPLHDVTAPD